MSATSTLAQTTLSLNVGANDSQIPVASTTGMYPGLRLFFDGELTTIISLGVSPWVNVIRGVDGTLAQPHQLGVTVYIGRGDQFYQTDPIGRPTDAVLVSPYINLVNGAVWFAMGNELGPSSSRYWQKQNTAYDVAAFAVLTSSTTPTVPS